MLNVDQEEALEVLKSKANIFLTGEAGSGKTYLAKQFALAECSKKSIALTATTGIAALNLGGETVHRFLGLGITTRPEDAELIIKKWEKYKYSPKPWERDKYKVIQNVETIVIDEASMLRRDQFELIELVLSTVRDIPYPFGGVQIILVGDFFQLPPVVTPSDESRYPDLKEPYCFQSFLWKYGKFYSINLTTNYRQSDSDFLSVLNKIRIGTVDDNVEQTLNSRINVTLAGDIKPIKLFPHKADVVHENMIALKQNNEEIYLSEAEYSGKEVNVEILKKECSADDKLYFCKNAQIVMITNDPKDVWVNGTLGKITAVDPITIKLSNGVTIYPSPFKWERVQYKVQNGQLVKEVVATMEQYPFKIGYSSTCHKSQGLSLDLVETDLSKCFTAGQAYVALSRVRTLDGLKLLGWNKKTVMADQRVLNFYGITNDST